MSQQHEFLEGWNIDTSYNSEDDTIQNQNCKATLTQPSDQIRQNKLTFIKSPYISPLRQTRNSNFNTALKEDMRTKFVSVNQLLERYSEKLMMNYKIIHKPSLNVTPLRLKLNSIQQPDDKLRAYTQLQLSTIMKLKRKDQYLRTVLKKVCYENDERYQKSSRQDMILGYKQSDDYEYQSKKLQQNSLNNSNPKKINYKRGIKNIF